MTLTMRDLLDIAQVNSELLAGSDGLDRKVTWAHSCELDNPWDWFGPDELLMTVGMCIPESPDGQAEFIRKLDGAGLAGLAIGDDLKSPPLSRRMLDTADALRFPLLLTRYITPFATISRTVAFANQSDHMARVSRLSRLYTIVRSPGASGGGAPSLQRLAKEFGYALNVLDARYGTAILTGSAPLSRHTVDQVLAQTEAADAAGERLPARIRVETPSGTVLALPVPCSRPALLVVDEMAARRPEPFVLMHVVSLIAVEVERLTGEREQQRRLGAALFTRLLDNEIDGEAARPQLEQLGLPGPDWLVAALAAPLADRAVTLLADHAIPHLCTVRDDTALILADGSGATALTAALTPWTDHLGTSPRIRALPRLTDTAREARWALHAARSNKLPHVNYADATPLFLPRTVEEAQSAVRTALGPLLAHDHEAGSDLLRTLEAFLDCDRSWQRAAERLTIHRQTLGYRLRTIERLTGRKLGRSKDIAELWLALAAHRIIEPR